MSIHYVLKSNNNNKIDYELGFTQAFADASTNLNVTNNNYNIIPAKKIYDYVQNVISTSSSGGSSIYYKNVNHTFTFAGSSGYGYHVLTLNVTSPPSGKYLFPLKIASAQLFDTTWNTGGEDVNRVQFYNPYSANGQIQFQISHSMNGGHNYTFSCIIYYAFIDATENTATTTLTYLNPASATRSDLGTKNYKFDYVPLIMQFEDLNTPWKTFQNRIILEQVKDNFYWCTVSLSIFDTFPTNREKETIIRLPFDFANVPSYHYSHGTLRFTVQGYGYSSMFVMQRVANHTNGNATSWVYLMLPSQFNDNIWISPKGWPSNFNQGMQFTMDGTFRYLCDITTNYYGLQIL